MAIPAGMETATATTMQIANIESRRRPRITLTYAQSLDGSIAARRSAPLLLSGPAALQYTHELRAAHDAILVGIGTVLSDNPQLNVRFAPGPNPRPVILDSRLRCPVDARCIDAARGTLIAAAPEADPERRGVLEAAGAEVLPVPVSDETGGLDLDVLLARLEARGIRTLMVEGGARVITTFLRERRVDRLILSVAPVLVGGVRGVTEPLSESGKFPRLRAAEARQLGADWIIAGEVEW